MLPKKYRLSLKRKGKKRTFAASRHEGQLFNLAVYPAQDGLSEKLPSTRFAFIVSSRISKKAVVRNHTRRLLGEAVQKIITQIKPGFEIVVLARPLLVEKSLKEIQHELEKLFRKAGVFQL